MLDSQATGRRTRRLLRLFTWRRGGEDAQDSFDETFWNTVIEGAVRHHGEGVTIEQVEELIGEAIRPAIDAASDVVTGVLQKAQRRMLREHRRIDARFRRRLRRRWGGGLDRLYAMIVAAEEIGAGYDRRHADAAIEANDTLFEALTRLHARACRIAFEVHTLLSGGFPMGGLARCRTMHEIAVTSMVLQDFGRTEQHSDIAERYLLHDVVINYKDAVEYQKNCDALGYEPFADGEMWSMKADRDAIIARFGPRFDQPYGWAATAIGNAVPKFTDLEAAAKLSHLRSHYKWACHENHADAKGARMNTYDRDDFAFKSSGPLDIGLADPGHMAAISLHQITVALLLSHKDVGPYDLMALSVLQRLVDSVGDLLLAAEAAVDAGADPTPALAGT